MTGPPWTFLVSRSFNISGRGAAVVGTLLSGQIESGRSAEIDVEGDVRHVERVTVELIRKRDSEEISLLLQGVTKEHVPPGSVIRGPADQACSCVFPTPWTDPQ